MPVTMTRKPDLLLYGRLLKECAAQGLIETGRQCIVDNTSRIDQRMVYDDGPQRENSEGWKEYKRKTKGHDIPLKFDEVLCNPNGYTINGAFAFSEVPPPVETLSVNVRITDLGTPPRSQVVQELRAMGYRYWGISQKIRTWFKERMVRAISDAREKYKAQSGGSSGTAVGGGRRWSNQYGSGYR
jgi:hypothetical protein